MAGFVPRACGQVVSEASYRGPVLVRGQRLDGGGRIDFETRTQGELRLPAGTWDEQKTPLVVWERTVEPRSGWRIAISNVLMASGGCYGLQVDGRSFSYSIHFDVIWVD